MNPSPAGPSHPTHASMTTYDTLISADQLAAAQRAGTPPRVLDCSFELTDPEAGRRTYDAGHVPGAHYLHLDQALSAAAAC